MRMDDALNVKRVAIEPQGRRISVLSDNPAYPSWRGLERRAINIVGREGYSLKEYWADGVKSYLGMMPSGFPNTFMPLGPLNGGTLCNFPRCIETNVDWVIGCIQAMEAQGKRQIDARPEDEARWVDTVAQIADQLLFSTVDSWFNGQNTAHRPKQFLAYFGGNPNYHAMLAHEAQNNYPGFTMR